MERGGWTVQYPSLESRLGFLADGVTGWRWKNLHNLGERSYTGPTRRTRLMQQYDSRLADPAFLGLSGNLAAGGGRRFPSSPPCGVKEGIRAPKDNARTNTASEFAIRRRDGLHTVAA